MKCIIGVLCISTLLCPNFAVLVQGSEYADVEMQDEIEGDARQNNSEDVEEPYSGEGVAENGELGMPTGASVATGGNLILKIEWTVGTTVGVSPEKVRYLIYRSDSYDGEYEKIGYTPFNTTYYYDGGGATALEEGKTYYYKIQAYAPEEGLSSNLFYFEPCSGVAVRQEVLENEFYTEDQMVAYLRNGLIERKDEIEFSFWVSEYVSGYHKTLYEKAAEEQEDLSSDSSAGDYFQYHIRNFDAELEDLRIEQNGLKKYKLVYWPEYYTTANEELQVNNEVERLIESGLQVTENSSDIEKVKAVYDYLASNSTYDLSYRNEAARCSAYDVLINHKAVCQGFANASYKLLRELGIMNRIVKGEVYYNGEWREHAWNLVYIDGFWYHFDVTTEVHFFEEYGYVSYKWFLKNDRDLGDDFRKDPEEFNSDFENSHLTGPTSIIVSISEVPVLTAEAISSTTIALSWNKVIRATGYELYRATSEEGQYELIKDIPGRETADKNIERGIIYYYKVRAYEETNGEKIYSAFSEIKPAIALETPVLSSTSFSMEAEGVKIKWKETQGAEGYVLYRSSNDNKNYIKITDELSQSQYLDTDIEPETVYYYKIQPYYILGENITYGSFSNEKSVQTNIQMTTPKLSPSSGVTMKISWDKMPGMTAYSIYRAQDIDGEYQYLKTTTGESTSDTDLTAGTRYYYKLAAYKEVNGKKEYILLSDPIAAVTLATPKIGSVEASEKGCILTWSKASGADRYNIYRSESRSASYEYVASVVGGTLSYEDTGIKDSKTYYYKVRAYKRVDRIVYYGQYSQEKSIEK